VIHPVRAFFVPSSHTSFNVEDILMRSRKLFASYSRKDRDIVSRLCDLLRVGGTRIFRDEDSIQAGKRWKAVLTENLQASECVLVFWSTNSATSLAVREEYTTAIKLKKDVAPILLDETPLIDELCHFQWIDFRSFVVVNTTRQTGTIAGGAVAGAVVGSLISPIGAVLAAAMGAGLGVAAKTKPDLTLSTPTDFAKAQLAEVLAARVFEGIGYSDPHAMPDPAGS
jgi:hypothetical protein